MLTKTKKRTDLTYIEARQLADAIIDVLRPLCEENKCMVAGSVRRCEEFVGDIEIVCQPKIGTATSPGELLPVEQNLVVHYLNTQHHHRHGIRIVKGGNRYHKVMWGSTQVDIFMPLESQWGRMVAIRTGPKYFSVALQSLCNSLGYKGKIT